MNRHPSENEFTPDVGTLEGALDFARRGYPVFPCRNCPGTDGHKAPLTKNGFHDATTDPAQISAWWQKHPDALIGMPTGARTGIAVLDLDKKNGKDGYAAVSNWQTLTPVIAGTASGGAHLYFRADGHIRSKTGKDGVDVRGDGGYVIVPPSAGYAWTNGNDLSALPPFPADYRPQEHASTPADELTAEDPAIVAAALSAIPNDDEDWDSWKRIGMAVWAATGGSEEGFDAWDEWSAKSGKYDGKKTRREWEKISRSPPNGIGAGTIIYLANEADAGWSRRHDAALEEVLRQAEANLDDIYAIWGLQDAVQDTDAPAVGEETPSETEETSSETSLPSCTSTRPEKHTTPEKPEAATTPEPPKEQPKAKQSSSFAFDAGLIDLTVKPRQWLLDTVYCSGFVTSHQAAGGTGKTALGMLRAMALASGRKLTGEHIFRRAKVLFVSLEDDRDELVRRLRAAMIYHDLRPEDLAGWLFLSAPGSGEKLMVMKDRKATLGALHSKICGEVREHGIDLVIIDPLVKSHGLEENDNNAMDQLIGLLASMAATLNVAIDVPHHTSKGAAEIGNADRGRGASAVKDGARLVYTLTKMSVSEAELFGLNEDDRQLYFRIDPGKVNLAPPAKAKWFKLVGVNLGNGEGIYQHGDNVHTVEQWTPPDAWDGVSDSVLKRILDDIERGVPADAAKGIVEGSRYSAGPRATTRAAWQVVARHTTGKTEKQCRDFIAELLKKKMLVEKDYRDPNDRKTVKGLYVEKADSGDLM